MPRLHRCKNKVPFWDFKEFAVTDGCFIKIQYLDKKYIYKERLHNHSIIKSAFVFVFVFLTITWLAQIIMFKCMVLVGDTMSQKMIKPTFAKTNLGKYIASAINTFRLFFFFVLWYINLCEISNDKTFFVENEQRYYLARSWEAMIFIRK